MIHLYIGDGKGKTTAAMGLCLRMAGRGKPVLIAQFMKGCQSGERAALAHLPSVTLLEVPEQVPFSFCLTREEFSREQQRYRHMLSEISAKMCENKTSLLILDEVCDAINTGLISLQDILRILQTASCEIVLTGRAPSPELLHQAHYITNFQKQRHPFDQGTPARLGIEF